MYIDRLIEELTLYEGLPEAAIREATERRDELLPVFLREIEAYLADEEPVPEMPTALFMIVHLLGSWHEKSAYCPVAHLLMSDPERLDWQLGDAITETVPRIMLNLFDGDQRPIRDIIECETANEYIRAEMLIVLATLAYRGDLSKDNVAEYLRNAYSLLRPQSEHYVWVGWEVAVASLGLSDLSPLVEEAFDRGFINTMDVNRKDFRREMKTALSDPDDRYLAMLRVTPFGDTVAELSTRFSFSDEATSDEENYEPASDADLLAMAEAESGLSLIQTVVNPHRHVGRNDPCPCGSGKKFKRCCRGKVI
jgi:hypothetical protein